MRYTVTAYASFDNYNDQAQFNSLSLAIQWAKSAAALEGRMWDYRVTDNDSSKTVAICHYDGMVETPCGIAI